MAAVPNAAAVVPVVPAGPPTFTVKDAMVLCGVSDVARTGQANSDAERIAENIFDNDFENCMDFKSDELESDLKGLNEQLPVNRGRIAVLPNSRKKILAFIQWTKDMYRTGLDPTQFPFPVAETKELRKRMVSHQLWVKKAESAKEPKEFTKDMKWDDWVTTLIEYLSQMPGRNGVPLKYIIRDNDLPDPTPKPNFLEEYVAMAPLNGEAYIADSTEVLSIINKLIVGNDTAEGAVKPIVAVDAADGRGAFQALRDTYEGKGLMRNNIVHAEHTIDNLFYKNETLYMPWKKFEAELVGAYATVNKAAGRTVHDDDSKLRKLQQYRIKADFLKEEKAAINAQALMPGVPMNFEAAMQIYRTKVQTLFPHGSTMRTTTQRRAIAEVNQNRGGRGRGGRSHHRNNQRNNRRHQPNQGGGSTRPRNRQDHETIVLRNGQQIFYHPSYDYTQAEWRNMTDGQRDRLRRERREYSQARRENEQAENARKARIAQLETRLEELTAATGVPHQIQQDQQTQISQVSTGTKGSIYGGRNRQQRNRDAGSQE